MPSPSGYAIRVTERHGQFRLQIAELSLVADGAEIGDAHALLMRRLDTFFSWAEQTGMTQAVPGPSAIPSVRTASAWQESQAEFGLTIRLSERPIVSKIVPRETVVDATHSR